MTRLVDWRPWVTTAVLPCEQSPYHFPSPVLAHFDRLVAQGHRGVALVHHGVCGECHLRVSSATAASLVRPDEIFLCENCGCYLLLAPEESIAAGARAAPVKPSGRPARRKPVATAA